MIGEVLEPKIYPASHHRLLYRIGYGILHDETPRSSLSFERPYFYGLEGKNTKFYYDEEQKDTEYDRLKNNAKK